MTELQHVYITAHGHFTTGNWVGESAQFGLRLAIVETLATPDKGSTFTLMTNGDVAMDQGSTAGAHGLLSRSWTARRGPIPSSENCDAAFQIDCAEDMWVFLDAIKTHVSGNFAWTHIKMAPISAAGKTVGASSLYTFTAPLQGTGTSLLPPQVAYAITLRANIMGRRGRGRVYIPAITQGIITSDGVLLNGEITIARAAFVALINALQNLPGTPQTVPIVVVMSAGSLDGVRPTEVRIGNKLDTIRSRRAQVPEVYATTTL